MKTSPFHLFSYPLFLLFSVLISACSAEPHIPTPTLSPVETKGKEVFNLHCAACHATSPDTVIVGPSLAGIANRAGERVTGMDAPTYLQTSILKPDAFLVEGFDNLMLPDLAKQLSGEDFDAVIAYLMTLK
jgi:mono/diheme cytochrome c family protein